MSPSQIAALGVRGYRLVLRIGYTRATYAIALADTITR